MSSYLRYLRMLLHLAYVTQSLPGPPYIGGNSRIIMQGSTISPELPHGLRVCRPSLHGSIMKDMMFSNIAGLFV